MFHIILNVNKIVWPSCVSTSYYFSFKQALVTIFPSFSQITSYTFNKWLVEAALLCIGSMLDKNYTNNA